RIVNIEPSIQAAFVDFGVGRNGFLHVSDVEPAYYRHLEPPHRRDERPGGPRGGHGRRGHRRGEREDGPPRRPACRPPRGGGAAAGRGAAARDGEPSRDAVAAEVETVAERPEVPAPEEFLTSRAPEPQPVSERAEEVVTETERMPPEPGETEAKAPLELPAPPA